MPGAVSVGGGFPRVLPAHRAVLGACRPATIGLESMQEQSSTIHFPGNPLADALAERDCGLVPVIVLPPGYEVGHLAPIFLQPGKQQELAVEAWGLGRQARGGHLQVGEPGNDTRARHVPLFIEPAPGFLLADVRKFCEYCM